MATRKTTTTKTTTGTTGGKTTTKATKATKATKTPNALSTKATTETTDGITTAIKEIQKAVVSLREEVETIKASITKADTGSSTNSGDFVTMERMDSLLTILNQYTVWNNSSRAANILNKWKNNKI